MQTMFINDMPEQVQWTYFNEQLYVKLHPPPPPPPPPPPLRDFTTQLETNANIEIRMLPVGDVRHRLNTGLPFTLDFIRLFVAACTLLLFSAFFNFLNLHLDLFRQRIHELRQRTVVGAKGWQLVWQMMLELSCIIVVALAPALCLVVLARPVFSGLLGIAMELPQLLHLFTVCGISLMAFMLITGFIPFWRLSRLAFRHTAGKKPAGQFALRRMAVTVQLAISVVFIVAALVVMRQMHFVNHKDLGFDHHGIIQLSGFNMENSNYQTALMQELTAMPQIENITATDFEIQHGTYETTEVEWAGKSLYDKPAFQSITTDCHFAKTFNLTMMQGEWWREGEQKKIILNEEAVRVMELSEPIGAIIRMYPLLRRALGDTQMEEYEVVGVVKDFHTLSLRSRIYPAIFREVFIGNNLCISVLPGHEREVMQRITAILPSMDATMADVRMTPFDEMYDRLNYSEQAGLKMFSVLATVCLLISLFGIYAVATASTRRRRKEIAIRKVFGAGVRDIIRMFFREYALQVALAAAVALPLAYYAMNRWLQGYVYRTNISLYLLVGVVVALGMVVLLTVLGQVLKAAHSNPAEVIKSE
jgi:ABC-type lipoprotein release transport system permease subunit